MARLPVSPHPVSIRAAETPAQTGAPHPIAEGGAARPRRKQRLGDVFGVNRVELDSGVCSSLRHWHSAEDEFVYVLEGELMLETNAGETLLRPGDCAGFQAGVPDGRRLVNRTARMAVYLEVGARRPDLDEVDYPDVDLLIRFDDTGVRRYRRRDGTDLGDAD